MIYKSTSKIYFVEKVCVMHISLEIIIIVLYYWNTHEERGYRETRCNRDCSISKRRDTNKIAAIVFPKICKTKYNKAESDKPV